MTKYAPFKSGAASGELRSERNQQRKILKRARDEKRYLDAAAAQVGLDVNRVRSHAGQLMVVAYYRSATGERVAAWWCVSGHVVYEGDMPTDYGIEDEVAALRAVANRLGLKMET